MGPASGSAATRTRLLEAESVPVDRRAVDTPEESTRRHPDELPEVGDEVRLVVVARVGGDAAPVLRRRRHAHGALEASGARELLGADAHALVEGAAEVSRRDAQLL